MDGLGVARREKKPEKGEWAPGTSTRKQQRSGGGKIGEKSRVGANPRFREGRGEKGGLG